MNKLFFSAALIWCAFSIQAQSGFTTSNLPIMVISTNGQEIPDEPKVGAQMSLIDNGPGVLNQIFDPANAYNGAIGIELRGSSSFFYEKRPYSIELRDDAGADQDVSLLGMPPESDFALISPLNDKSLIRDVFSYTIAREVMPWAPRTRYVEVVLNGEYIGVYILLETVKRDSGRVNIAKIKATDIAGPELTGGYIIRIDKDDGNGGIGNDWASQYPPVPGGWQQTWFQHFYPKNVDLAAEQQNYIRNHIKAFDNMMAGPNFNASVENWVDIDSWVNYLLVQEVSKNIDGYRISAYFYKDRDDAPNGGKITMGPVWDFNITYGIGDYCEGIDPKGWGKDFNSICGSDGYLIHFWWEKMWNNPVFRQRLLTRWQELRGTVWSNEKMIAKADSLVNVIGDAQVRNFQRWQVLGTYVWPNSYIGPTYSSEVNFMKNWLLARLAWMDVNIQALQQSSVDPEFDRADFVVYPNPTNGKMYVKTDAVIHSSAFTVQLFDQLGRQVFEKKYIDAIGVFWVELPAERLSKGVYTCVISNLDRKTTYREQVLVE
jgi:hypothetical protein